MVQLIVTARIYAPLDINNNSCQLPTSSICSIHYTLHPNYHVSHSPLPPTLTLCYPLEPSRRNGEGVETFQQVAKGECASVLHMEGNGRRCSIAVLVIRGGLTKDSSPAQVVTNKTLFPPRTDRTLTYTDVAKRYSQSPPSGEQERRQRTRLVQIRPTPRLLRPHRREVRTVDTQDDTLHTGIGTESLAATGRS